MYRDPSNPDVWYDGRLLAGPAVEERSVHDVHNLPPDTPVLPTVAILPVVQFSANVMGLFIGGGAAVSEWRRPRVERDPVIDKEDTNLADRCEKFIQILGADPRISGRDGGRVPEALPPPGAAYSDYVRHEYRKALAQICPHPRYEAAPSA